MNNLRHIWFIALKDLKLFVADPMALFFALLFPFLMVVIFSLMMSGVGGGDNRLELHLVTQEAENSFSHEVIGAMVTEDDSQLEPGEPRFIWLKDYNAARQMVEDKEIEGFLAFPSDFTEGVLMGYGAQLEVVVDAEAIKTRAALNWVARAIAFRVGTQRVVIITTIGLLVVHELYTSLYTPVVHETTIGLLVVHELYTSGDIAGNGQFIEDLFSEQGAIAAEDSFIEFEVERVGEVEAWNAYNLFLTSYLVMFVFFVSALSAINIVRERQKHTLERLLAGSVRRESILGGIFAGTAAKGLIQLLIFWTVGILVFNIDIGLSPAAVFLLSLLLVIMSSAFGIMLATLVKTERSALSIAVLASVVLAPLGGCWWPLFITPQWMQFIGKLTPHGWANTGFNKLMCFGADFGAAVPEMLALIGFAAVFGIIAIWRFRTSAA